MVAEAMATDLNFKIAAEGSSKENGKMKKELKMFSVIVNVALGCFIECCFIILSLCQPVILSNRSGINLICCFVNWLFRQLVVSSVGISLIS